MKPCRHRAICASDAAELRLTYSSIGELGGGMGGNSVPTRVGPVVLAVVLATLPITTHKSASPNHNHTVSRDVRETRTPQHHAAEECVFEACVCVRRTVPCCSLPPN